MPARKTHEEIKAAKAKGCPIAWLQCREIEKVGSFAAWEAADIARIASSRPAGAAWAKREAARMAG